MEDEAYLLGELSAPVRSFRLYALEKIIQEGSSQNLLNGLLAKKEDEEDPECGILIDHAIATVRSRLEKQTAVEPDFSPENFARDFGQLEPSVKLSALNKIPKNALRALSANIPDLFRVETDQMVRAIILRTFGRYWPRDHLKDIASLLRSDHLSTRIAVLEILIQHAPDLLSRDFPKLLISRDPRVRALAVRGLAKVDIEEAIIHLETLFESRDPPNVTAALQNSVFFPFDRIKSMLLNAFALATDTKMVERIGMFLENNPDPEIPYRLWEMAESAQGEKSSQIKEILKRSSRNIEQSGILEDFTRYSDKLKQWILQRSQTRWVQELINRLCDPDVNLIELEALVREKLKSEQIKALVTKSLSWSQSQPVREILRKWLSDEVSFPEDVDVGGQQGGRIRPDGEVVKDPSPGGAPGEGFGDPSREKTQKLVETTDPHQAETSEAANIPAQPTPFPQLGHEEKVRQVASWQKKDLPAVLEFLTQICQSADTPPDLLATGLRASLRLELNAFPETARKSAKSKEANLTCAALEYLEKFNPDWLLPYLGSYLQSDQLRIKSTSLRILQRTDPKQSLSVLQTMLSSKNSGQQKTALACMVHFEFGLLRGMLFRYLLANKDFSLVETGLFLFKANPETENLYLLYCLEKTWEEEEKKDWAAKTKEVREENENLLSESGQLEKKAPADREAAFSKRWAEEKAKAAKPPADYSVKVLAKDMPGAEILGTIHDLKFYLKGKSAREILGMAMEFLLGFGQRHPAVVGLLTLGLVTFWVLIGWEAGEDSGPATPRGMAVLASNQTISGNVQSVSGNEIVFQTKDGKTYILLPPPGQSVNNAPSGLELKMNVVPFRSDSTGAIHAQIQGVLTP